MISTTGRIRASDGTELLLRRWSPDGAPIGGAVILHGLGEHSGRHDVNGRAMAGAGILAVAPVQRGFGGSGGRRLWVDDWSDLHRDVADRVTALRAELGDRPIALYGHSLGATIALGYVLDGHPRPDLLVLSAPALADTLAPWKHAVAGVLARVAPSLRIANGVVPAMLAADPAPWFDYGEKDPLVEHASTVRFGARAFAEQDRLRRLVASVTDLPMPTLVVHGGEDPLVPVGSSVALGRMPSATRNVYPNLRHEIHNELRSSSVADVVGWLRARMDGQLQIASGER